MDAQLRVVRIIHMAMLAAAALYVIVAEIVVRPKNPIEPALYYVIVLLVAVMVTVLPRMRRMIIDRSLKIVQVHPDDTSALARWRAGYIIIFGICEAVVLYGLLLRFLGATLAQALPFYAAGILLLLLFAPRKPQGQNATGQSTS